MLIYLNIGLCSGFLLPFLFPFLEFLFTFLALEEGEDIRQEGAGEGFDFVIGQVKRAVFPTDDSLFKMLYLAMMDITKKWTGRRQNWSMIHAQLAIFFADRMPG